jgi:ssRNA-specific RNase YbeY (16S rRNA maturation enzyme)
MTNLNKKWLGKEYPTDVLSFPLDSDLGMLGDIVICYGTALRQVRTLLLTPRLHVCFPVYLSDSGRMHVFFGFGTELGE